MIRKNSNYLVLAGLLAMIALQVANSWNNYIKPWFKENRGFMLVSSPQRTGILLTGTDNARLIRFLQAYLPQDARLVMPPEGAAWWFTSQNFMQNFLFPRPILACCDWPKCECLKDPGVYTLAVGDFPAHSVMAGRVFVPYPESNPNLSGIYVPEVAAKNLTIPALETYAKTTPISVKAMALDGLVVLALFLLGGLLTALIFKTVGWADLLEAAVPLGMGLFSWALFLVNYAGIPLALSTVVVLFILLTVILIAIFYLFYRTFPTLPPFEKISFTLKDSPYLFLLTVLIVSLSISTLIAFGRGYSNGDDIVNWSMKGYVMADSGSIWTGQKFGGHILAYPMNLILSIATFRLVDGDILPGSKSVYVFLTLALIYGSYRFLRLRSLSKTWAVATVLAFYSIPFIFYHSTLGYANLPFTSYLILGILNTLEGLETYNLSRITLGGFQLALSAWTRPEGILFALAFIGLIYFMVIFIQKTKIKKKVVIISLFPMLIPVSWMVLLGASNIRKDQIGNALSTFSQKGANLESAMQALQETYALASTLFPTLFFGRLFLFSLLAVVLAIPITRWYNNRCQITFLSLTALSIVLPVAMFVVAAPNELNFNTFLIQSLTRAYIPALVLGVMSAGLSFAEPTTPPQT